PVLLAALEPDIRERVRFVLAVGGYYSLQNVVAFLTTGYYPDVEPAVMAAPDTIRLSPHPYSQATFIRSNLELLKLPVDREFFRRYAAYVMGEHLHGDKPQPTRLASDAQAFYNLLDNRLPAEVPGLLQRLAPRMRAELEGINPAAHDLSRLRAEVILLHGRGDRLIPYTESIALAEALPAGQAQLFIIDGLAHVDFRPKAHDVPQLLGAMQALLEMREPR
ncbi:MAG: hypothetical protein WBN90_15190, partial [Gammaproteobacteria bacterium]